MAVERKLRDGKTVATFLKWDELDAFEEWCRENKLTLYAGLRQLVRAAIESTSKETRSGN